MKKQSKRRMLVARKRQLTQERQDPQISRTVITNTILDTSIVIGHLESLADMQTTHVSFDFQFKKDGHAAVSFKSRDGAFVLVITQHNAYIVDEKSVTYIDEPIELQENKDYQAECGVKLDALWNDFILYARIWQEEEQQHEQ